MHYFSGKLLILAFSALVIFSENVLALPFVGHDNSVRRSVVKIYATVQRADYAMPWQSQSPSRGTGSGFIISRRRILTNAHVISDAKFLQVQKDGDPTRYAAYVAFSAHDCDLAILAVEDPAFFKNTESIKFAEAMPGLNDTVTVFGYPLGGNRLSITRGVVSRIDYSTYSHSGVDQHLVLQVDAAINPGNSGGPVFFNNRVVGLAFQGLMIADNIGYAIPLPVINRFLQDVADGFYHGYPELGVAFFETRNPALRNNLKLSAGNSGVVIYHVDPFGSAHGYLKNRDVLLAVDNHRIASDGTVIIDGNPVIFAELMERKQCGDQVSFDVWREGKKENITIPLNINSDPFWFRNTYDEQPPYYITGGLVFSPLSRDYLRAVVRKDNDIDVHNLFYYMQYAKIDNLCADRDQFVVLIRRLPHPVNTYAEEFVHNIVAEVNDTPIRNLLDMKAAFAQADTHFHTIKFEGIDDLLVIEKTTVDTFDTSILRAFGIANPFYFGEEP